MKATTQVYLRLGLVALLVTLYGLSLYLPAASIPGRIEEIRVNGKVIPQSEKMLPAVKIKGYQAFSRALLIRRIDWFANPVFWCGCVLLACRKWLLSGLAGTIALLLGMYSLFEYGFLDPELRPTYLVGFWIWLASLLALAIAGWAGFLLRVKRTPSSTPEQDDSTQVASPA